MAVKIRLKRIGRRNRPFYRIVAIDSRTRRDGPEIERLGWFDPLKIDVAVDLDEDRIIHWLQKGAQPSETVNNILSSVGLQYKMHLIREGKSEEEIASALTEWQLRQEEIRVRKEDKKKAKKKVAAAKAQAAEETAETDEKKPDDKAEIAIDEEVATEQSDAASAEDSKEEVSAKEDTPEEKPTETDPEEVKADEELDVAPETSEDDAVEGSKDESGKDTADDKTKKENS